MSWRRPANIGMFLLGIWLIGMGAMSFVHINLGQILALLAIASGGLILLGR